MTVEDFERIRSGIASAAEIEAAGSHVAECPQCAQLAESELAIDRGAQALRAAFGPKPDAGSEHPDEESLSLFVSGELDRTAAFEIERHLASCSTCRREADDLRQWISFISPRRSRFVVVGSALAAALILAFLWTLRSPEGSAPALTPATVSTSQRPSVSTAHAQESRREPEWDALIAHARQARVLPFPRDLRELATPDTLRGPHRQEHHALWPAGTAVLETRPSFRWQTVNNATYRVAITADEKVIAQSTTLTTPEWHSSVTLAPDVLYRWEVHVEHSGTRRVLPAPPAAPAFFRVVGHRERAAIEEARRVAPGDHFLLALLYARAGIVDHARRELESWSASTGDPLAQTLLRQLPAQFSE